MKELDEAIKRAALAINHDDTYVTKASLIRTQIFPVVIRLLVEKDEEIERLKAELSGSEAVYGFASWLTIREKSVTLSAHHDAAVAADLVKCFCDKQGLREPREDWTDRMTTMSEEFHD